MNDAAEAFGEGNYKDKYFEDSDDATKFKGIIGGQGIQVLFKPWSPESEQDAPYPLRSHHHRTGAC